ncbi:ABC-type transport auxiliary lipoprotein family protein [Parvibaculaceae bacterium PLY_AMNH_Bact1]|nr:ABC-type transport auxiliary lipoprotein family protein [Parvibaculaceae bacterium PLY_AMNH_Bact1]
MKKSQVRFTRFGGIGIVAIALQACALAAVGTSEAPDIYVLTSPMIEFGQNRPQISTQIVVDAPEAPAALNSNRIVFQPSPNEIRYFSGARWADRVPDMVQVLLVDAMDQGGRFQAVGPRSAGIRSDYLLQVSISRFGVESEGSEMDDVHVRINSKLVRRFSDTVISSRRFESVKESESTRTIDVVSAFDEASSEVLSAIALWAYDEIIAAERTEPAS